jgi:hypothetical protein
VKKTAPPGEHPAALQLQEGNTIMKTKHLIHKNGGTITAITGIGHRTVENVPYWFYQCDVTWDDGTKSSGVEVLPDRICADQSNAKAMVEINKASDALTKHLRENGKWLKKGQWVGDRLVHWVPRRDAPMLVRGI